jgi:hypothetical protein
MKASRHSTESIMSKSGRLGPQKGDQIHIYGNLGRYNPWTSCSKFSKTYAFSTIEGEVLVFLVLILHTLNLHCIYRIMDSTMHKT